MKSADILKGLKTKSDRSSKTVYLSESLVNEAEKITGEGALSRLIEALLEQFVKTSK